MKWNRIAVLVITLIVAPQIQAEGPFAGITLGLVSGEESDTENLGFVAGHSPAEGFGFEVFYLKALSEDNANVSGLSGDISTDTWGILGVYKTAGATYFEGVGDIYFKGKVGYGVVSVDFDVDGGSSIEDSASGFALGLSVGTTIGPGDLELSYTMLPDLGEYSEGDVDADTDIIAVTYLWYLQAD